MKRFRLVILSAVVVVAVGLGWLRSFLVTPKPVWVSGPVRVVSGPAFKFSYPLWTADPFAGGKLWVTAVATNEQHFYLFDMESGTVLGELRNVDWAFPNADVSRLFCAQPAAPGMRRARIMMARCAEFVGFKYFDPYPERQYECYWLLDPARNSTRRLGELFFLDGTIDEPFRRSPNGRFGCFKRWAGSAAWDLLIADLATGTLRKEAVAGELVGWWDDHQVLLKQADFELTLYDVLTTKKAPLVSSAQLAVMAIRGGLTNGLKDVFSLQLVPGSDNSFYVHLRDGWNPGLGVLGRLERPGGSLKLIDDHFKWALTGELDSRGEQYLVLPPGGGSLLRNVASGQSREIAWRGRSPMEGAARFYHDDVVCDFTNTLWRFHPDGTNPRQIFPPPDWRP